MNTNSTYYNELIAALSMALDMERDGKLHHAWRTAAVTWRIANKMGLKNKGQLFYGGLLHDIGAIGLNDHIVHQVINPQEKYKQQVLAHSKKGSEIIKLIPGLDSISIYILDHHENWDGTGYPNNKTGMEITLGGQIINIADNFDIVQRVNPNATRNQIIDIMARESNKLYSSYLFSVFEQCMSQEFFDKVKCNKQLEVYILEIINKLPLEYDIDYNTTITALATIIDTKHKYTAGHSHRVAYYSMALADAMELPIDSVEQLLTAGMLHDIGKIAVPSKILDKTTRLTKKEFQIIKSHPEYSKQVLNTVNSLGDIALIAGAHHERVDGTGYPLGLKGSEIPMEAKILSVADAFDAMTSIRPYQSLKSPKEAIEELKLYAGTQFDKEVVELSTCLLDSENYIRDGYNVI